MTDRICKRCKEPFLPHGRERVCPDCDVEPEPRDLVDELSQSEGRRLARGLRQMNNAGR